MNKNMMRAICFLLIGIILFGKIQNILKLKPENMGDGEHISTKDKSDFYESNHDIMQVIFLGTSTVYCGVSPLELYKNNQIISYDFTSSAQPMAISYFYLKEALKTQHPKVVVVDIGMLFSRRESTRSWWELAMSAMPFSKNYLDTVRAFGNRSENSDLSTESRTKDCISILFPIYEFHERWKELNSDDFQISSDRKSFSKGYLIQPTVVPSDCSEELMNNTAEVMTVQNNGWTKAYENNKLKESSFNNVIYDIEIDGESAEYLFKIRDLCNKYGIKLQLIKIPVMNNPVIYEGAWIKQKYNIVKQLANNYNMDYLDLMYDIDLQIDWDMDTMDGGRHLNILGAKKVSSYLGNYLVNKYELEPQKDLNYDADLEKYIELSDALELQTEYDFQAYINYINKSDRNLSVLFAVCEDISGGISDQDIVSLKSLGLQSDFNNMCFADVFIANLQHTEGKNKIVYEEMSNRKINYEDFINDKCKIAIKSVGGYEYGSVSIEIDNGEETQIRRGLSIVVYDNDLDLILDSVCFDFDANETIHYNAFQYTDNYINYLLSNGK